MLFFSVFNSDEGERKAEVVTSSDEEETAQEKKLRLAKEYLANLEQEGMDSVFMVFVGLHVHHLKRNIYGKMILLLNFL